MADQPARTPRVSLSKTQIQEGIGAELFSLCQSITEDGKLTKDEVLALGRWLGAHKDSPLPTVAYLAQTLHRILADGKITREKQKELLEAIEKILPPEARKEAKAARRAVESQREKELAEKKRSLAHFDFMVAGVQFEGREQIIRNFVNEEDRLCLMPEPNNKYDRFAVAVCLRDGRTIGYVPREESRLVTGWIAQRGLYVAYVKIILDAGRVPIPVAVVKFYGADQANYIQEQSPDPCPPIGRGKRTAPARRKPWWQFW